MEVLGQGSGRGCWTAADVDHVLEGMERGLYAARSLNTIADVSIRLEIHILLFLTRTFSSLPPDSSSSLL